MDDDKFKELLGSVKQHDGMARRKYQRIQPSHLEYARNRFAQLASTSAVRAELKANGGDYSHSQLHYHWTVAAKARKALHAADDDL